MEKAMRYDWLIVGAGVTGSVFAREMTDKGYRCLVIDKRPHIGGQCYCENIEGVDVHKYGAHIFHTASDISWQYFLKYAGDVRRLPIYTVQAMSNGQIYPLPFNMNTFAKIWPDVRYPEEARNRIKAQTQSKKQDSCNNLRDEAIRQVGQDVFDLLIKGYTEKQWGKRCEELPAEIIGRIPVRFVYDNNYYFCDKIGIPRRGYNEFFKNLLKGIEVRIDCDILKNMQLMDEAENILCTSPIDEFFDYYYGKLEYRSLHFDFEVVEKAKTQGTPVVNFCDDSVRYTRRIEHNLFTDIHHEKVVFSYEYPQNYEGTADPYYPIPSLANKLRYQSYKELCGKQYGQKILFAGRLGGYRYISMDEAINEALELSERFERISTV